tara:strand:+ start:350 stop:718 length:369 start_codon:yes stop_codon:yes gene_type:complete
MKKNQKNVLGGELQSCCMDPVTGFYRDGYCHSFIDDSGKHLVCVKVTEDFLAFSKSAGNDLSTPIPDYQFPGLKDGDQWCLCAVRWQEAFEAGMAPKVLLESTHEDALSEISLSDLMTHQYP